MITLNVSFFCPIFSSCTRHWIWLSNQQREHLEPLCPLSQQTQIYIFLAVLVPGCLKGCCNLTWMWQGHYLPVRLTHETIERGKKTTRHTSCLLCITPANPLSMPDDRQIVVKMLTDYQEKQILCVWKQTERWYFISRLFGKGTAQFTGILYTKNGTEALLF